MSELYPPVAAARESYARLFLRAIGYRPRQPEAGKGRGAAPNGRRNSRTKSSR
jgi:hypothetical protein